MADSTAVRTKTLAPKKNGIDTYQSFNHKGGKRQSPPRMGRIGPEKYRLVKCPEPKVAEVLEPQPGSTNDRPIISTELHCNHKIDMPYRSAQTYSHAKTYSHELDKIQHSPNLDCIGHCLSSPITCTTALFPNDFGANMPSHCERDESGDTTVRQKLLQGFS